MTFQPHGRYHIQVVGNQLHLEAQGPWNTELVQLYGQDRDAAVELIDQPEWGLLAVLKEKAILSPEVAELMRKNTVYTATQGHKATAFVLDNVGLPELVEQLFREMYQGLPQKMSFFPDVESAKAWLDNELAS